MDKIRPLVPRTAALVPYSPDQPAVIGVLLKSGQSWKGELLNEYLHVQFWPVSPLPGRECNLLLWPGNPALELSSWNLFTRILPLWPICRKFQKYSFHFSLSSFLFGCNSSFWGQLMLDASSLDGISDLWGSTNVRGLAAGRSPARHPLTRFSRRLIPLPPLIPPPSPRCPPLPPSHRAFSAEERATWPDCAHFPFQLMLLSCSRRRPMSAAAAAALQQLFLPAAACDGFALLASASQIYERGMYPHWLLQFFKPLMMLSFLPPRLFLAFQCCFHLLMIVYQCWRWRFLLWILNLVCLEKTSHTFTQWRHQTLSSGRLWKRLWVALKALIAWHTLNWERDTFKSDEQISITELGD